MNFRLLGESDLPMAMEIYNQAIRQGYCTAHLEEVDMDHMQGWFADHPSDRYPVFLGENEQGICGWISLGPYRQGRQALEHVGEVSYYIHLRERRRGWGSRLMAHAIRVAPEYGFSILLAILLEKNPNSVALLEKFKFSLWASLPGLAHIEGGDVNHLYYGLKL